MRTNKRVIATPNQGRDIVALFSKAIQTGHFICYLQSTSAMDGILTFLWYVERYLRLARLEYPRAYSKLADDPCWRNAILTIGGRAWIMLEAAEGNGSLEINDVELFELVRDPDLLDEIQRLREKEGCAN